MISFYDYLFIARGSIDDIKIKYKNAYNTFEFFTSNNNLIIEAMKCDMLLSSKSFHNFDETLKKLAIVKIQHNNGEVILHLEETE